MTDEEQRARLEKIETALVAPLPDVEAAKERLAFLCNSQSNEAIDWRRYRYTDPVLQLEEARMRSVVAIYDLRDEASRLYAQLLKLPETAI